MRKRMLAMVIIVIAPFLVLLLSACTNESNTNESNEIDESRASDFQFWWEREYNGVINENRVVTNEYNDLLLSIPLEEETDLVSIEAPEDFVIAPSFTLFSRSPHMTEDPETGWDHFIELQEPQDLIYIIVENISLDIEMNFVLKIFYNYEEVAFSISGSESYNTEFLFSPPPGYKTMIPIHLNERIETNNTANRLTVGIFMSPELFTSEDEDLVWEKPSLALNYEVNFGTRGLLSLTVDSIPSRTVLPDQGFHSLMINNDLVPLEVGARIPPSKWIASPGEEIEMAFATTPAGLINEDIEEFLIISMLDWQQIPMNNEPYLLVSLTEENREYGHHGEFFITAPDDPGLYEFQALLVPNPRSLNGPTNFYPLELSMRFTIAVE